MSGELFRRLSYFIFFLVLICKYHHAESPVIMIDRGCLWTIKSLIEYAYNILFIFHNGCYGSVIKHMNEAAENYFCKNYYEDR